MLLHDVGRLLRTFDFKKGSLCIKSANTPYMKTMKNQ